MGEGDAIDRRPSSELGQSSSSSTPRRRVSPSKESRAASIKERRDSSKVITELQRLEACPLNSVVNDEVSVTAWGSSSLETSNKDDNYEGHPSSCSSKSAVSRTNSASRRRVVPQKSFEREVPLGSDLEDDSNQRKPSRISIDDRLTVFCDSSSNASPLQSPSASQERVLPSGISSLFDFFWSELTRGYSLRNDQSRYSEKRKKMYAFIRIPMELEQFLGYGLLQCTDAFCYLFTFLPLRFLVSILGAIFRVREWTSAETCDALKVFIIICASFLIREIDSSVLYHQVKSQGAIKLYIFYNMLEVADRLFSSLGQDVLDVLFWTANEPTYTVKRYVITLFHLCVAVLYATLHTFLVILQATTLNVAFNSQYEALLALLMSNNFVELKGAVFKKFAKANLFQMACSDVRERFHIIALLFVVMIRNSMTINWSLESAWEFLPDIMMVIATELLVDWLKHAFITKFNEINAVVYKDFTITIAFDVIRNREQSAFSDFSDQVSRRMGFIPIPLSIVMIRVLSQTFTVENKVSLLICFIGWLLVFAIKICNSIVLLGKACQHVKKYRDFQDRIESDEFRKRMVEKKSKSVPNSPRMSLIDFTDVLHQPQPVGKFYTVSDMSSKWGEVAVAQVPESKSSDRSENRDEKTPRRARSMAHLSRDQSDPSTPVAEDQGGLVMNVVEQSVDDDEVIAPAGERTRENSGQCSPKKRMLSSSGAENNEFGDVTAYRMPEQGVQRIE